MLAQGLPHLSYLGVEKCNELEQIIDKDETSASLSTGHLQPICFPNLTSICMEECNNLKSLFSVSVAFSQLKWFTIRGASKLEQGVGDAPMEGSVIGVQISWPVGADIDWIKYEWLRKSVGTENTVIL
ncbi:hypothetical protein PTKIN_Ptkin11bG0177500 [Pterospermum kingtungense]